MRTLAQDNYCEGCGSDLAYCDNGKQYSQVIGVEYTLTHPQHYDGVSEWRCPICGRREGRWTGRILQDGEYERRFGSKC